MGDERWPPRIRSALFVPGGRPELLARAGERGADALIVDLEDSVVGRGKAAARAAVTAWLDEQGPAGPAICVRVNPDELDEDVAAVVHGRLTAVVLPKVAGPEDVRHCDRLVGYHEGRVGLPHGRIRIWPLVETAGAVREAHAIATASPRVAYMGGATADGGDLAGALGFRWTPGGLETLHVRSRVLVDVRAAGMPNPVTGLVAAVSATEDVRRFAEASRDLGYEGMMAIHPSHVPVINEVFGVGEEDRAAARAVIAALRAGAAAGRGAVVHEGRMVDLAMARAAAEVLREAGDEDVDLDGLFGGGTGR